MPSDACSRRNSIAPLSTFGVRHLRKMIKPHALRAMVCLKDSAKKMWAMGKSCTKQENASWGWGNSDAGGRHRLVHRDLPAHRKGQPAKDQWRESRNPRQTFVCNYRTLATTLGQCSLYSNPARFPCKMWGSDVFVR